MVETGPARPLYSQPVHPYTRALLSAVPQPDPGAARQREILQGSIPSPLTPPSGCVFRTRCPRVLPACAEAVPPARAGRPRPHRPLHQSMTDGPMSPHPTDRPEARLALAGIVLPDLPPNPIGSFTNVREAGGLIYVSGQGPVAADGSLCRGKVGGDVSAETPAAMPNWSPATSLRRCAAISAASTASAGW